jgi:hypothetical protein
VAGRRSVTRSVATRVKCGVRMSVVCFFVVHGLRDDVDRSAPPMPEKSGGRAKPERTRCYQNCIKWAPFLTQRPWASSTAQANPTPRQRASGSSAIDTSRSF